MTGALRSCVSNVAAGCPRRRNRLVRFVITPLDEDTIGFEQAFPDDGGRTWEVNWIATDTRIH